MIKEILLLFSLVILMACGCNTNQSSSNDTEVLGDEFTNVTLYAFQKKKLKSETTYQMYQLDGITHTILSHTFDFSSKDFRLDNSKQVLVDGKRRGLDEFDYELDGSNNIIALMNNQKMIEYTLSKEVNESSEHLLEYNIDVNKTGGSHYEVEVYYLQNMYIFEKLASSEVFESLKNFIFAHQSVPFIGGTYNGLVFGADNKLEERRESNYKTAGSYEIKKIDNQEILFVHPDNTNRYGKDACYILDFSRVWEAECHLKESKEIVNFYDESTYQRVLKYMQTAFVSVQVGV